MNDNKFAQSLKQVYIIPLNSTCETHAKEVYERIQNAGFKAHVDLSKKHFNHKIRNWFFEKFNFMIFVGPLNNLTVSSIKTPQQKDQINNLNLSQTLHFLQQQLLN